MQEYHQLTYQERIKIYRSLCQGKSIRSIAKLLEREPSTISREIRRNSDINGYFYPGEAHQRTIDKRNINLPKIDKNRALQNYIIAKLNERWSPRMIAGRWSLENKNSAISAEAIYQWIYSKNGERFGLKKLLIRAHKKRGLKRKPRAKTIKDRVSIHKRPEVINQRAEHGHFECDLFFNSGSQSKNVCTLIERVTRFAVLIRNDNKNTKTVIDAIIATINTMGLKVKSITFDNGSEFSDHIKLNAMGIDTFFCDPGSPWQKGGIENLNNVARRHCPFAMLAEEITDGYIVEVNHKINNMPRQILGYKTPLEVLKESGCLILENQQRVG